MCVSVRYGVGTVSSNQPLRAEHSDAQHADVQWRRSLPSLLVELAPVEAVWGDGRATLENQIVELLCHVETLGTCDA